MSPEQGAGDPATEITGFDWLALCRRCVEGQRELLAATPSISERTEYEGVGEGGDNALAIDRRCEDIVFAELERVADAGASFLAVSEERGEVAFGAEGAPARVVIDPIDGSMNARRLLPSHSLSFAVASGGSMADVEFGYVYDFGAEEEFVARRAAGAEVNGRPLAPEGPADSERMEVVGLEAVAPELALPVVEALQGKVYRFRIVGSIAIAESYVGGGRFDGMLSLRPCRSVDAAASQLIAREAGAVVSFGGDGLESAGLGLDERYPALAARSPEHLETLAAAWRYQRGELDG